MLLSQASYRGAGLAAPLATLTVVNPVVAAAVGITMFGETFRYGSTGTALALSCGVVAAGGLILLTTERIARAASPAAPEEPVTGPTPVEELLATIPEQPEPLERPETVVLVEEARAAATEEALVSVREEALLSAREDTLVAAQEDVLIAAAREEAPVPVPEEALVPAQAGPTVLAVAYDEDDAPSADPARYRFYGPFYGGSYVPAPDLDRHRVRVRS
jgi:hypothetical protein